MGLFDAFKGMMGGTKSAPDDNNNLTSEGKVDPPTEASPQESQSSNDTNSGVDDGSSTIIPLGNTGPDNEPQGFDDSPSIQPPTTSSTSSTGVEPPATTPSSSNDEESALGVESSDSLADDTNNQPAAAQFSDNQKLDSTDGLNSAPLTLSAPTAPEEDDTEVGPGVGTKEETPKSNDGESKLPPTDTDSQTE